MKFAYADPPYLGVAEKFYGKMHDAAKDYDNPETHKDLIARLESDFDGWALSLHVPSLRTILPMVPEDVRICAWVKPFASFKPGVRQAWAWEPVIVRPLRKRVKEQQTVRDWVSSRIAMQRGFPGAKPDDFCFWMFEFAGLDRADEFVDLFPGSGAVTRAHQKWLASPPLWDMPSQSEDQSDILWSLDG